MKTAPLAVPLASAITAFTAFVVFVAFPARAGEVASAPAATNNAPRTRAEVEAELAEAKANGELSKNPSAPDYPPQFAMGGYAAPRVQISTDLLHAARPVPASGGAAIH
ncbi:DUF4148 domain-containing protein [Paraburkholderia sp.]|uniref:DUF4148 domain-containing protein n=1 Tax=Paraburkholderia sp. TaxID=1926495 RepID=UPI0025E4FC32|nr:DUF4148 domain-containing protein [Paraburkholderia sp.]